MRSLKEQFVKHVKPLILLMLMESQVTVRGPWNISSKQLKYLRTCFKKPKNQPKTTWNGSEQLVQRVADAYIYIDIYMTSNDRHVTLRHAG